MKLWKRFLTQLMAAGLMIGLLTVGAFAAEDVARIGDTGYGTLEDAVKVAQSGDTITLISDASLNSSISAEKNLIIDLGGHDLNVSGNGKFTWEGNRAITLRNGTLSGSGTIVEMKWNGYLGLEGLRSGDNAAFSFLLGGGSVILSDCSFSCTNGTILLINGADVTVRDGSRLALSVPCNTGVACLTKGGLTVEDAVIAGVGPGVYVSNTGYNAKVTLKGGAQVNTESSSEAAIKAEAGSIMLEEGASLEAAIPVSDESKVQFAKDCSLTLSEGKYVVVHCNHEKGELRSTTPATCTDAGKNVYACTHCDMDIVEVIPALSHAFGEWETTKEATCTNAGERTRTCERDGCEKKEIETIEATGHTEVTDAAVEATCTTEGKTEGKHCSVCNAVLTAQETIPVKGHTEVIDAAVEATCTAEGKTEGKHCSVCGEILVAQETVPSKAHTENGGVVTTPATATTPGVRTYSCTVCGRELRTETIPAIGGSTGGGSTGGGSTGGGSTGGGSTGGGSTGGGSGEEDLPDANTPQTGEPETGDPKDEENLGENDTPLVEKPFLFMDVGENRWFYPAVKYVFDRNLMGGIDTVTFSPNLDTSRGMLVMVLYRLDGAQERGETPDDPMEFGDVPAGKWFTDPVLWASDKGVVNGYGTGNFGPNDNVTREQVAAIFYRYAQYKGCDVSLRGDLSGYTDSDKVAGYARDAMSWAVGTGIIGGMDTVTLAPKGNATRAQIATMLMRFDQFLAENQKDESTNQTVG